MVARLQVFSSVYLSVLNKDYKTNMSVIMWKRLGNTALGYKLLEGKKKTEFIANSMCVWEHV